jgi:hypothetical protein
MKIKFIVNICLFIIQFIKIYVVFPQTKLLYKSKFLFRLGRHFSWCSSCMALSWGRRCLS